MCMSTPKAPKTPEPPAPPPPAAVAPKEIENAVDSTAEQRKKKRSGSKQLRRGSTGVQAGGKESASTGSGLTIKK